MSTAGPLTCFVIGGDGSWLRELGERAWDHPRLKLLGTAAQVPEALEQLRLLAPAVVLLDESAAPAGAGEIARACGGIVLRMVARPTPEAVREALSGGARGVLPYEASADAIVAAAEEAQASARRALERWQSGPAGEETWLGSWREARRDASREHARGAGGGPPPRLRREAVARQAVIAVHSPKGGVGKTTLSINLAMTCAASPLKLAVGLLDLDPEYADVAAALHVAPTRTVLDWVEQVDAERDPLAFLARHPSGLYVLPGPLRPPDRPCLTAEAAARMFAAMRRALDVVVIDTGTSLHDDATLLALEQCTHGLIVASTYVPALREIDALAKVLQPLQIGARLRLVFNRVPRASDGLIAEAAQHLPWPIAGVVPEDPDVVRFANDGRALAVERPQSAFGRAVRRLAQQLVPIGAESPRPRGLAELLRTWQLRRAGP